MGKEAAQKRNSDSITRKDLHIPNWLPCKRRSRGILVCKQALELELPLWFNSAGKAAFDLRVKRAHGSVLRSGLFGERGDRTMNMLKQARGVGFRACHLLPYVFVLCMVMFCGRASFADAVIANFDIAPDGSIGASQGQIVFSLNANGTIAANVMVTNGNWIDLLSWSWGASNPTSNPPVSGESSGKASLSSISISSPFGTKDAAIICTGCGPDLSFTIGDPGEFTSVLQAFNCTICQLAGASAVQPLAGTVSSADFVLEDSAGNYWGADAQLVSTPEPGTLALLGTGLLGLGPLIRRRLLRV